MLTLLTQIFILRMGSGKILFVLCVKFCFSMCVSTPSFAKFVKVDFLEGSIFNTTVTSTVQRCVVECAHHTPSCRVSLQRCVVECAHHTPTCRGSRYHVVSKECQLLDRRSRAPTTRFDTDGGWKIYMAVGTLSKL